MKKTTKLEETKAKLINSRPVQWEQLPDIELYMDQLIGYMERQHIGLSEEETLTPAMINNYIKVGLMPRANGKKYGREHIAYLTIICLLKQIMQVGEIGTIFQCDIGKTGIERYYKKYIDMLNEKYTSVGKEISNGEKEDELMDKALNFAIGSYANKIACQAIIKNAGIKIPEDSKAK